MLAVAIPTINEADNIAQLTHAIDKAAVNLNIPITIINSDNNSADGTAAVFQATQTLNNKVSLSVAEKGKGRNVKTIFEHILSDNRLGYCFLIDGDVTSFEPEWLSKHLEQYAKGTDYVVPNYARSMQEGNTTNHFAFPLLKYHSHNNSPQQPIAGDFGISRKLIHYLCEQSWPNAALKYGIDIYMTTKALFGNFNLVEINLDKKLHKPSYGKMIGMFEEVATSYYETIYSTNTGNASSLARIEPPELSLIEGSSVARDDIDNRRSFAKELLQKNRVLGIDMAQKQQDKQLTARQWAEILADHEKNIGIKDANVIARSLLPYYLLRVTTYLSDNTDAESAKKDILNQANIITEVFQARGL